MRQDRLAVVICVCLFLAAMTVAQTADRKNTVRFGVADTVVVHEELEIEALAGGDAGTVDTAGHELLRRLPDRLVPWPYSKLEVGRGLERMAAADRLPSLTPEGRLDADGYRRLGQEIAGSLEGDTDTALA